MRYVNENLKGWYEFIKTVLCRDVDNGELRVVYGCRKSSAFGIATVNNGSTDPMTELTFSIDDSWATITGCKYRWHHRGCAEVKAGPSLDERQDIIGIDTGACDPINQCLFISTIDIRLSEDEWQKIDSGEQVPILDRCSRSHSDGNNSMVLNPDPDTAHSISPQAHPSSDHPFNCTNHDRQLCHTTNRVGASVRVIVKADSYPAIATPSPF